MASIGLVVSKENKFEMLNLSDLGPMALVSSIHIDSCSHLVNCIGQL